MSNCMDGHFVTPEQLRNFRSVKRRSIPFLNRRFAGPKKPSRVEVESAFEPPLIERRDNPPVKCQTIVKTRCYGESLSTGKL